MTQDEAGSRRECVHAEDAVDPPAAIEWVASDGAGQRLDRYLAGRLTGYSRARIQRWIDLGAVTCDERELARDTRLAGHETLRVEPQPLEAEQAFRPQDIALQVVHEDPSILVIDKPAGLVVHPAPGHWTGTMLNGLLALRPSLSRLPRAGIVHRLDKDTSGLLVVALRESARVFLVEALAARRVSRNYLALVAGRMPGPQRIDAPIGRDPRNRLRMAVVAQGKPAITDVEPLAWGESEGGDFTAVRCSLHTGRTHQIRVHLAHRGHPLLADPLYGGPRVPGLDRQALHAFRLGFDHPEGGPAGPFESALPADLDAWLRARGLDIGRRL